MAKEEVLSSHQFVHSERDATKSLELKVQPKIRKINSKLSEK